MDRHSELQKLTTDACDALKAATDDAMGYTIFDVGNQVRIVSGSFAGVVGGVVSPCSPHESFGTVIVGGESMLLAVTVKATVEGRDILLRVPPELLERVPDPGREAGG